MGLKKKKRNVTDIQKEVLELGQVSKLRKNKLNGAS